MTNLAPTPSVALPEPGEAPRPPEAMVPVPPAAAPPAPAFVPMSEAELDAALAIHSPALAKELYEAAQRQVAFETARQGRLDTKATGLLQAAGLSLTVASTVGAQLASRSAYLKGLPWGLLVLIGLVLASGLVAAGIAVWALRVRHGEYAVLNERDLFSRPLLEQADTTEESKDKQEIALTVFRRSMTTQLWQLTQRQERIHNQKAAWIWYGQLALGVFFAGLLVLGLTLLATYR